jgi:hypothetical protein
MMTNQLLPTWRSKLFLDYYGAQGLGTGAEIIHRKGQDSRLILSGYRINEKSDGSDRWVLNGDLYQSFASSFSAQGRLQKMTDPSFNNDYARASPFPVTAYLLNSDALVYHLPRLTTRLSYSRQDNATSTTTFVKATEDYPRLDLQSAQLKFLHLPWLNTLTGFADNNFTAGRGYLQKSAGGTWEATRVFNISHSLSFTPRANYSETIYDQYTDPYSVATSTKQYDARVGQYLGAGTLRWRNLIGNLDVTHTYTVRDKVDSFTEDAGAVDHGILTNLLTAQQTYRPTRSVRVQVGSGYDFRVFRTYSVGFRDRVQPITSQVYYTPRAGFDLSLRDDYQLTQGNQNLVCNGTFGDRQKTFISAGTGFNHAAADHYYVNTEAGWAPSSGTWHLTGAVRSLVLSPGGFGAMHSGYIFDKELTVVKEWHDFETRVGCRFRPGNVKEATVYAQMKFGNFNEEKQKVHDWESEWFPERAHGDVDRP